MCQLPRLAVCITALGATEKELRGIPTAIKSLDKYFEVAIWSDIGSRDLFESQPVANRLRSLNWAFESADIVMPWKGGFNSIELLFDFENIKAQPDAVFVGLSDNTILTNALPAMGTCRAWQGPGLWNWLENPERGDYWSSMLAGLYKSDYQAASNSYNQAGLQVLQPGRMNGKIWGGNNYTFDLLQGTNFCPDFSQPYILFLEGEDILKKKDYVWRDFFRNVDSILLQKGARDNLQGLILGRFPRTYELNKTELEAFVTSRPYLSNIPVVYDFPCGHFPESLYLPLGEELSIDAQYNKLTMTKLRGKE